MPDIHDIPDMPDLTIQTKNAPTKIDKDYVLDFYKGKNPIIAYAAQDLINSVKETPNTDYNDYILSDRQLSYIDCYANDISNIEKVTEITLAEVVIWKRQSKLFNNIIKIIKEAQAERLESAMWKAATNPENKDNISKMFLLKARKQEYKENAPPPPLAAISLRISIEGEPISAESDLKPVYDVSDEKQ